MAALDGTITSEQLNAALSIEMVQNFKQDYDRLAEILGVFAPEVRQAGSTIYQLEITGSLDDEAGDESSSGEGYVEGDVVTPSQYSSTKTAVAEVAPKPYRKLTTAAAILEAGYEQAILRTDQKMLNHVRAAILGDFFDALANGTSSTSGDDLQYAIAMADATLGNAMEDNGDSAGTIVHFINRMDAAEWLGAANITTQTAFGLGYLAAFLGFENVFLTSQVPEGTVYVTPAENIHVYGLDFDALGNAGLDYVSEDSGLIGVNHSPAYDRVSAETNVVCGMAVVPEVTSYIVSATIGAEA